jgi:hypothetical protein
MTEQSPYQQMRHIGFAVNRITTALGVDSELQTAAGQKALEILKRSIRASQDSLKDYEMFQLDEDTKMQATTLPKAIKSVEKVRDSLLKASEYDLVGAVDVAQIAGELDELIARLG